MNEQEIDFYYKNEEQITAAATFKRNLRMHIVQEAEKAGNAMENVSPIIFQNGSRKRNEYCYYKSLKIKNLLYTIHYEKLSKVEKLLTLIVEVKNDIKKRVPELSELEWTSEELQLINAGSCYENHSHAHFAVSHHHLEHNEIANLSNTILELLESKPLITIFEKIETYCVENNLNVR